MPVMTTYQTSPACFKELLEAAQALSDRIGAAPEGVPAIPYAKLRAAITAATDAIQEAEGYGGVIEQARESYASDDIEIDDSPLVSPADKGCWVAAWVWVESDDDESAEASE